MEMNSPPMTRLEALGGRCVFASEIDREAVLTYRRNFGPRHLHGDVTELDLDSSTCPAEACPVPLAMGGEVIFMPPIYIEFIIRLIKIFFI
jgi:hypothetical protein